MSDQAPPESYRIVVLTEKQLQTIKQQFYADKHWRDRLTGDDAEAYKALWMTNFPVATKADADSILAAHAELTATREDLKKANQRVARAEVLVQQLRESQTQTSPESARQSALNAGRVRAVLDNLAAQVAQLNGQIAVEMARLRAADRPSGVGPEVPSARMVSTYGTAGTKIG